MAQLQLMPTTAIPAAGTYTTTPVATGGGIDDLLVQAAFVYGSGGTTVKAYVQTTIDGTNWIDIMTFAFALASATRVLSVRNDAAIATPATPTDGTLADNTVASGMIGELLRVKYVVAGTYVATTLAMSADVQSD